MLFKKKKKSIIKQMEDAMNKPLTEKEASIVDGDVEAMLKKIKPQMDDLLKKLALDMNEYTSQKKDLNTTLLVHRKIIKNLMLYPVRCLKVEAGKKPSEENAYFYNMAIAKDIVDEEMVSSGALDKINKVLLDATDDELSDEDKKKIDYVG